MKKQTKSWVSVSKGFTLIELLIVIAIIGILASIVTVSAQGSLAKAKRASALTTASSVLPELVTCQDDGGNVSAPASSSTGGGTICSASGHTVTWPNLASTGWIYVVAATTNANIGTMTYTLTKSGETTISCSYAGNSCT